ncbi:hypothetical protein [Jannaschia seohaensis]|uniref:Lipoprotein n=1 Tax=Jannaschia seohaensis TaxID=475081 RepID=A0A2Y9B3D9_9RHOB|nr:hypothetical protein [Jannaschia seohaensis]PWJ12480.1 hypothetical protein BCF38_11638 [Jannaschia seohaensis]SSA50961.1 hypothetical protein SAMN05421539_11638 [Jannaschia seohaensis]
MRVTGSVLAAAMALTGCGGIGSGDSGLFGGRSLRGSAEEVQGIRFRSRVTSPGEDARRFMVATRGADRAPPQAVEAARIEAVRYCLTRYGGSNIEWTEGPDRPVEEIPLEDGVLVLSGRCLAR